MSTGTYRMRAKLLPYPGMAAWHFLTLPQTHGADIKKRYGAHARGWGSLPVTVTIGKTKWTTSIFPDKKSGSYLLPVKAKIRKAEGVEAHQTVTFSLTIG